MNKTSLYIAAMIQVHIAELKEQKREVKDKEPKEAGIGERLAYCKELTQYDIAINRFSTLLVRIGEFEKLKD